jgi:hypothetical protein
MKCTFSLRVLLLCLVLSFSAAYGQGNCTIRTIVGTYAFNFTGSSTIVTGTAPDQFHWNALYAPIAGVGVFTVQSSFPRGGGTADGYYWLIAGAMNPGLTPTPFHATISVKPDCTGAMNYTFGSAPMSEYMLVLDNGNEIRSVATQTAMPTGTWITTARRVGGACTQNKVTGSYLYACKSIIPLDAANTFAVAFLMPVNISSDGNFTGTFTGKAGPAPLIETPVNGTVKVNADCTAEVALNSQGSQSVARAVFLNEGKEAYLVPLVNNPGGPQIYGYCDITQIAKR